MDSGIVDCESVTASSYSLIPFTDVPIALAGMAWSAAVAAGGVLALGRDPAWARSALLLIGVAGSAAALYLINAELAVIGRICLWCTALHALIFATLFLAMMRMREPAP